MTSIRHTNPREDKHHRDFRDTRRQDMLAGLQDYYDQPEPKITYSDNARNRVGTALEEAVKRLGEYDITLGEGYYSVSPVAGNILIAEAVNWAAKEIDYGFYELKPYVFAAAAKEGAGRGVYVQEYVDENGEAVWDLFHPEVGVASFHDRYGEVKTLLNGMENEVYFTPYRFPWSGVERQSEAFNMLENPELVGEMAVRTAPEFEGDKDGSFAKRLGARLNNGKEERGR